MKKLKNCFKQPIKLANFWDLSQKKIKKNHKCLYEGKTYMNDSEVKKWWDYNDSSTLDKIKRSITEINWSVLSTKGKRLKSFINKKFKPLPPFPKGAESDWLKEKFLQTCSIYMTPGYGERRQVSLFQVALAPSCPCLSSSSPAVEWRSACRMNRLSCYTLWT